MYLLNLTTFLWNEKEKRFGHKKEDSSGFKRKWRVIIGGDRKKNEYKQLNDIKSY